MERRSKGLASRYFVPSLMSTAQVADPEQPPLRLAASTTHTCRTLMSGSKSQLCFLAQGLSSWFFTSVLKLFFFPSLLKDDHVQQSHALDAASETQGQDRRESCKDSFCPSRLFLCSTSTLSEQSLGSHLAQYQLSAV